MNSISMAVATGMLMMIGSLHAQELLPAGHADAGAAVFRKCAPCHQVGISARNGVGPVLNGIIDRPAGTYPGYNYSPANKNSGLVWDAQTLALYLRAPRKLLPGTKMVFSGLKKEQDIADVIAHLKRFDATGKQTDP